MLKRANKACKVGLVGGVATAAYGLMNGDFNSLVTGSAVVAGSAAGAIGITAA
jgi:hypothetical protein